MLRYTIKPDKEIKLTTFPITELFVSPDLQYISGVTDINVGLVDGEPIIIKSPYLIGSELTSIGTTTVRRQGTVKALLKLPIMEITLPLNFQINSDANGNSYILANNQKVQVSSDGDTIISSVTQNYVEYNGDICYLFHGNPRGYLVDHKFYESSENEKFLEIETYLPIEDGKLIVGNYTYIADFSTKNSEPELRLSKEHEKIKNGDLIGLINGCECYFESVTDYETSKWKRVCKFFVRKTENPEFKVEDVLFGGYKHYVIIDGENYYLKEVYKYNEETDENVYLGYGILINGTFYEVKENYGNSLLYESFHDLPYGGTIIYINEYDEYVEVNDTVINTINGGRFVILVASDEGSDIIPDNYIIAKSNSPILLEKLVELDEDNNEYIIFEGKKYIVEEHLHDVVNMSDNEYLLTYLNDNLTSASTVVNGETIYFDINDGKAIISNRIYYKDPVNVDNIIVKYGINENGYNIIENSGVTINDIIYPVFVYYDEEDNILYKVVRINKNINIHLRITDKNGLNTYIAYPVIDENTVDEIMADNMMREYCNILVNNWDLFTFTVRKDVFGNRQLTVENGLMDSMSSMFPYSISDAYKLENKIELYRVYNFLSFKLPMVNNTANNLRREEIIKNDFVNYIKDESVNTIVDMEKDVYYPVWKDGNNYKPIQQIRFNLHFRNRDFSNWKTYDDNREFKNDNTLNFSLSNWFITDLNYYKDFNNTIIKRRLHHTSDLLGLINYTTDEIRNQSTKLGKSFLRLSFYSTNNPNTQVLLATSTVFFDENKTYVKYINSKRNSDFIFVDVKEMQKAGYEKFSDYQKDVKDGNDKYQVSSRTISDSSEIYGDTFFNDETRLSSRFVINDKYSTDTSSEGYYLYMFKDYSTKMRESTIFMKVEFNHAGIGKTIQFMLPRRIGVGDADGIGTPLYLFKTEDVKMLENGFNMSDIYKQMYIPIRVIYDDKTNKYVYYLPDELRENNELLDSNGNKVDDEIMEFNLFEIKFANESIVKNES